MPEICVAWTWKSTSPLHVGSGLSRPGVADSLVQRDHDRNPIIPGEAVKGALRMAAEQVAAWLGWPQDYGPPEGAPVTEGTEVPPGNAEPRSWPLACLFGGADAARRAGVARCTAATLAETQDNGSGPDDRSPPLHKRSHVFASTAINRTTGTAKDNTLRKTEYVPADMRFEARYTACVADGETEVVETLLLAALAAAESVGGKAGIGWGRMELVHVTVAVDGKDRKPTTAVTSERLKKLQKALSSTTSPHANAHAGEEGTRPAGQAAPESPGTGSELQWFKLTIELQEPTCLPDLPEFSNQVTTQDCIPATTLRGALGGYWRQSGCSEADVRAWLSDATAWTPALRTIDGRPTVPAPRSFVTTKRAHGKKLPVHDTFRPQWPKTTDGDSLQWRSLAGRAINWSDSKTAVAESATRETRMHVARDYRTGSKRAGALYARESLAPDTRFVAWAHVPKAAFQGAVRFAEGESGVGADKRVESFELLLGKRLSAGNGRAKVDVECTTGPQFFDASADDCRGDTTAPPGDADDARSFTASTPDGGADSRTVFVQLVSPAVVRDRCGYPRRTLDRDWWESEFGGEGADGIEIRKSLTAPGRRGGWMAAWRHARAAVTTVEAGSVWRLCCKTTESAASLREQLRERGRIGERTHEGFGWIVVDPPWLGRPGDERLDAAESEPPKPEGEATPWPGVTVGASCLAKIARRLAKTKVSEENARAHQEIAARVVRIDPKNVDEARKHLHGLEKLCKERAARRESKWKPVEELLSKYNKATERENAPEQYRMLRELLLFELGILVTRGTPVRH